MKDSGMKAGAKKRMGFAWALAAVFGVAMGLAQPARGQTSRPDAIYSNTTVVRAVAANSETLWAATTGGLEEYDLATRTRKYVYTTNEGLPSLNIAQVKLPAHDVVFVQTQAHDCAMIIGTRRFACSERGVVAAGVAASLPLMQARETPVTIASKTGATQASVVPLERVEGAAVTARLWGRHGDEWLATAGQGVWVRLDGKLTRVTPRDQIASNHVVAIAEWGEQTWFATFDRGLSVRRSNEFYHAPMGPLMHNDVVGTNAGLFVATSEGLFRSDDGETFVRDPRVGENSITDLAYDAKREILYVAATNSLWELELSKAQKYGRSTYQPGGSRSLQAVDVSPDGTVFLASEDRGVLRRDGHERYTAFDKLAGYPSSWVIDVVALGESEALAGTLRHGLFSVGGDSEVANVDPWILFLGRDSTANDVFVGTQAGAAIVEAGRVKALDGLPNACVHSIARLNDGLWVGTEGGLAWYRSWKANGN